ncbi:MAG: S41 family peptidase [Pseudomonadota bacterium]|nr:S41 family peptidase [Pseudomonadota bacterium]
MSRRKTKIILGTFISIVTIICAALLFGGLNGKVSAADRYSDLQIFTKVLNLIGKYYVEEVDTKKLIYGSIKGMLRELDPHTNFLSPEVYEEFESETSGKFGGLGIEITIQKGQLTIIAPIEDSPAWKAGIKAGDKIIEIDGVVTKGLTLVEAAQKMRGEKGAKIKLTIFREGFTDPKDFTVTREVIKLHSVKYTDMEDGYVYIKITNFIENTESDLQKHLEAHIKKYKNTKGIVLDMRGNPGGILDQAIKVSDMFIEDGIIVSTIPRDESVKEVAMAKKSKDYVGFPIIVLINESSASASEIVAGALQDNQRALIMGQRSFGKGTVQTVVKLGDGSALKMTTARYFTPSGKSIQAEGIHPDIILEQIEPETLEKSGGQGAVTREADIDGHLGKKKKSKATAPGTISEGDTFAFWWSQTKNKDTKDLSPKQMLLGRDFQALQAYNYLKAWSVMKSFAVQRANKSEK